MISIGMRLAVVASMLAPFACFCAGQDNPQATPAYQVQVSQPANETANGVKEEADHPLPQARDSRYQLHSGELLAIIFPLTPEFNQPTVAVQPDGYVTLRARPAGIPKGASKGGCKVWCSD